MKHLFNDKKNSETIMNWKFSHVFKANIDQLIFNQGCQPEK